MKYSAIFSHASRLRESGNRFILAELEKAGLGDIVPSHGDILVRLLSCEACNMSELARQVRRTKSTVTTLVEKTRTHPQAALGVRPRGALAVCRVAKAYASLNGRECD